MRENARNPTAVIGPNARYFDDFSIGDSWSTSQRTISETDLMMFADLTGDHNPVHTDEEFAKSTPFGGRILHGAAVFSIATGLEMRLGLKDGTAIAFLGMTWDMPGAIKIGDTIYVHQHVVAARLTKNPGRGIVTFWVEVRNQRGETCQQGEWKIMLYSKAAREQRGQDG